jgi:hypothetical protein
VEGYVSGLHRSPYHGFSIEFAEHREYAPGDDLRYVDWKVFGRTDKFYLKQYEDETNLLCYLVLDVSESMTYRSSPAALSKLEYAQAGGLGRVAGAGQQDATGRYVDSQIRTCCGRDNIAPQADDSGDGNRVPGKNGGADFHELAERLKSGAS